jgi:D-alanyl-D-alanine endopeptidase (penicillin-binding protein 7)
MFRFRARSFSRFSVALLSLCVASPLALTAEAASARTAKRTSAKASATAASTNHARTTVSKRTRYSSKRASARRARVARARAAAYVRALQEVQTPRFKAGLNGELVPDVRAEAAIIYNPITHEILWESNAQNARSIASITKVMTAVVFLEHASDLTTPVEIERVDTRAASTTYLRARDRVSPNDLLNLLLIGSDNAAARALARISPFGYNGFVERMNQKARELGLEQTHYADSSGLFDTNVSSAFDMARLISFASGDERIASIMRKSEETLVTGRRTIKVHNTNKLVGGDVEVRGGKTGFITKAGYCLATLLQLPQGDPIAVVVLGARSNAGRFMETKHLFNWLSNRTRTLLAPDAPKPQDELPH